MKNIKKIFFIILCAIFVFSGCESQSEENSSTSGASGTEKTSEQTGNQSGQESQSESQGEKSSNENSSQTENKSGQESQSESQSGSGDDTKNQTENESSESGSSTKQDSSQTENQSGQETQSQSESGNESSQTENQVSRVSVYSESKEFSDEKWSANITVSTDKFSSFSSGDKIILTFAALNFSPSYSKVKIYAAANPWQELNSGTYTNGTYDDGVSINPPCTLTYTATSSDAEKLKQNGLALNGYGFTLTKIEIQTSGDGNSSSSSESENKGSSENGSSTENSGNETTVTPKETPTVASGTPYKNHGKLHVSGAYLYDEHNEKYQLYGMSTHGLNFGDDFSKYVNKDAFQTLRDDWNTNCIRLVLYPDQYGGYCVSGEQNKAKLKQIMKNGIDYATELGMYVLIDWHIHGIQPTQYQDEAIKFLGEISAEYKNYGNVLYEICNEPTSSPWSSVIKPYAQKVIPAIRANAPDAIVIVGTNTWSQDIEEAAADKLDFENVMYTFHFYANTHTDSYRTRVENAVKNGLPVFITEFGTCDASGNGGFNADESQKWFDLIAKYKISHLNWSLCNKSETASAIANWCSKTSDWAESDLTDSGKLVRKHFKTLTK